MKKYIVTLEIGNYDAPRTYELNTDLSFKTIALFLNTSKFISVESRGKEYFINTSKIVCISEMDQPKEKIEMPNIENLPL